MPTRLCGMIRTVWASTINITTATAPTTIKPVIPRLLSLVRLHRLDQNRHPVGVQYTNPRAFTYTAVPVSRARRPVLPAPHLDLTAPAGLDGRGDGRAAAHDPPAPLVVLATPQRQPVHHRGPQQHKANRRRHDEARDLRRKPEPQGRQTQRDDRPKRKEHEEKGRGDDLANDRRHGRDNPENDLRSTQNAAFLTTPRILHRASPARRFLRSRVGVYPSSRRAKRPRAFMVMTVSPRWFSTSEKRWTVPRLGSRVEGAVSRTVTRAVKVSPGRTGLSQRSSSTPGEPMAAARERSALA